MSRFFCAVALFAVLAASALAATEAEVAAGVREQLSRNQVLQGNFENVIGRTLGSDLNGMWTVFSIIVTVAVFVGLALIEAASAEESETEACLTKYMAVFGVVALAWWALGYGLAYGTNMSENKNTFIGNDDILLSSGGSGFGSAKYATWSFQFLLAIVATSIVTQSVSGRVSLVGYAVSAFVFAAFVYPVNVHWIWSATGWLSTKNQMMEKLDQGVLDHSGAASVFLLPGTAALIALIVLGKRKNPPAQNQKDQVMILFGTLLVWVGFYGLSNNWDGLSKAPANGKLVWAITVAAATGGLSAGLTGLFIHRYFNVRLCLNGIIAGLVSVSAANNVIEIQGGCTIALAGGAFYAIMQHVINAVLELDDALDAVAIYMVNGFWGVIAASLWATKHDTEAAYPQFNTDDKVTRYGLFYGGGGQAFGVAMLTNVVTVLWSAVLMFITFKLLDYFGLLRSEAHGASDESEPTKEADE